MSKKKYKLQRRELTPEQDSLRRRGIKQALADREAIKARGRTVLRQFASLQQVFARLKEERLRQGITLAELQERSGIGKPALSRLENSPLPNPTIDAVSSRID